MTDPLQTLDMGGKTPRQYQVDLVKNVRNLVAQGKRKIIICAPTGAGKTFTAAMLIKLAAEKGNQSLFLAPRRELITQACEHLEDCDVRHTPLVAGEEYLPGADCVVASKDTLAARTLRRQRMKMPFNKSLLIADECHLSIANEHLRLLHAIEKSNPNLVAIGLSATPGRADGKGLGDYWQSITASATYEELIMSGSLVSCRVFAPHVLDMRGVRQKEWDQVAISKMDTPKLTGDIIGHWLSLASDRKTIVFASSVAHSIHLRDEFAKHGVPCCHVDDSTDPAIRKQAIADLKSGKIQVLLNCQIFCYGFDEPSVSCVVLACPCRSIIKFRQCAGRALRPYPGKKDCMLIDHSGAIHMFGFPTDDIEWPLEKSRNINQEVQLQRVTNNSESEGVVCQVCFCTFKGSRTCPNCGASMVRKGVEIAVKNGLLKEVKPEKKREVIVTAKDKIQFWNKCLAQQYYLGGTAAKACAIYISKVNEPPYRLPGMPNIPGRSQWKKSVRDLYPNFGRSRS